ncbi:hypothetical protein CDL15_Pgr012550 [Punica granatum]|uniref:Uncharacterized protein n=1 Tax=Punica granatum TaxID=22663 RepID=A0A218XY28_PUNGR|nr:hypothetical protein CDL15_Pgr012550 [Punica granatum]
MASYVHRVHSWRWIYVVQIIRLLKPSMDSRVEVMLNIRPAGFLIHQSMMTSEDDDYVNSQGYLQDCRAQFIGLPTGLVLLLLQVHGINSETEDLRLSGARLSDSGLPVMYHASPLIIG